MNRAYSIVAATALLTACLAAPARADIYSFRDAGGVVHFTNVPSDPRYSVMIRESVAVAPGGAGMSKSARAGTHNRYDTLVKRIAREQQLDQALLHAVITVESGYNPHAVSHKGAMGLMQLMPETARRYGVSNPYSPSENVMAGARYLRDLMQKFNNDLPLTLAAYNAGEGAIVQHGNRIPPYRETQAYVPKVLDFYQRFRLASHR